MKSSGARIGQITMINDINFKLKKVWVDTSACSLEKMCLLKPSKLGNIKLIPKNLLKQIELDGVKEYASGAQNIICLKS